MNKKKLPFAVFGILMIFISFVVIVNSLSAMTANKADSDYRVIQTKVFKTLANIDGSEVKIQKEMNDWLATNNIREKNIVEIKQDVEMLVYARTGSGVYQIITIFYKK